MPSLNEARHAAWSKVSAIDGWLSRSEASVLFDKAARAQGPIVEIGSFQGRSTAALALGAMAGSGQPVYAVDSFVGDGGRANCSPEILRRNLDGAGINGLVRIVPKASHEAAGEIPECDLLFVDGGHDLESVSRDLSLYLPRVRERGHVILHDCDDLHPGVLGAIERHIQPTEWRTRQRADSALVFEKRPTEQKTVYLGFPGRTLMWSAAKGFMQATLGAHEVFVDNSATGWDDMNQLWTRGLNAAAKGQITHFAMLHSDVCPTAGWLDVLANELDDLDADMISVVQAIKDERGLTSCGVGNPDAPWQAFRRFTVKELMDMPETFSIADTPHPDKYLLHNTGCLLIDLRKRLWRHTDDGILRCTFNFPLAARLQPDGMFEHLRESEDWYFSRQAASLGARTYATRKVQTWHVGESGYSNTGYWGKWEHDEHTRHRWASCQT